MLPMMGMAKQDNLRWVIANCKYCTIILMHLYYYTVMNIVSTRDANLMFGTQGSVLIGDRVHFLEFYTIGAIGVLLQIHVYTSWMGC